MASEDAALHAKQAKEHAEALFRKNAADNQQAARVIIESKNGELAAARTKIKQLERTTDEERKRRRDAEDREAALRASLGTPASEQRTNDSTPDVDKTLQYLHESIRDFSGAVRQETTISEDLRVNMINRIQSVHKIADVVASGVDALKKRAASVSVLRGSRDRAEAELLDNQNQLFELMSKTEHDPQEAAKVIATARATILSITKQLRAFNRQIHIPTRTSTIKFKEATTITSEGDANIEPSISVTIAPARRFGLETSKLYSDRGLSLEDLLKEFKVATRKPIKDVETVNALNEELRVLRARLWRSEKFEAAAKEALERAQLRLNLMSGPTEDFKESQDQYSRLVPQFEQCHKTGTERMLEIQRLRQSLKNAGKAQKSDKPSGSLPTTTTDGDELFTREARALARLLDDYITRSKQYQKIINRLERELADHAHVNPFNFSPEDAERFAQKISGLDMVKSQAKKCDEERSEDTPLRTPGGTKRKSRPGARLRRETRENKRREIAMHKNESIKDPHEPRSPPEDPDQKE